MKFTIADVVVRPREVEIEDVCPECGCDEFLVMALDYSFYEADVKNGVLVVEGPDSPDSVIGADKIPPVGVFCDHCNHSMVLGREKVIPIHDVPQVVEDTVWSTSLDCLIFEDRNQRH